MKSLVSYGVLLAGLVGLVAGIGLFTFDYGEGLSYFSTDPRACANCHIMNAQYASWLKVSDHWVRSPLLNISRSCQVCHVYPEAEIEARVDTIQKRTNDLMQRAAKALTDMLDAISAAKNAGASPARLAPMLDLQRKAQWRLDFVAAENSMGFHAPAEAARILAESIDYSRQAEAQARAIR